MTNQIIYSKLLHWMYKIRFHTPIYVNDTSFVAQLFRS